MPIQNNSEIQFNLNSIIKELSDPGSYNEMFHEPLHGEQLPSTEKLNEIVELLREILFPGFFGHSALHPDNLQYYIGVNINKLFGLIYEQILRGLCFDCKSEMKSGCQVECAEKTRIIANKF